MSRRTVAAQSFMWFALLTFNPAIADLIPLEKKVETPKAALPTAPPLKKDVLPQTKKNWDGVKSDLEKRKGKFKPDPLKKEAPAQLPGVKP